MQRFSEFTARNAETGFKSPHETLHAAVRSKYRSLTLRPQRAREELTGNKLHLKLNGKSMYRHEETPVCLVQRFVAGKVPIQPIDSIRQLFPLVGYT